MDKRRLVGIDLGISSAHTVRVADAGGGTVCCRKAIPTVASLTQVEQAALAGAAPGVRLEVVLEPTGPAWLPIVVCFTSRGHTVYRVSSAKALTCVGCFIGTPSPTASTPTPWPGCRWSTRPGCTPWTCPRGLGRRWTAACAPATGSPSSRHPQAAQQGPGPPAAALQPLTGDLGQADLAVLERYADPHALLRVGQARLTRVITAASHGHQGHDRAAQWLQATQAALQLYDEHPAVAFAELAAEVQPEVRLLRATQAELARHAAERERCYRQVDPLHLARSLPGFAEIGAPALVATMGSPGRFQRGANFRSFTGLTPAHPRPATPTAKASHVQGR